MSRVIKFRAWDKENIKMESVDFLGENTLHIYNAEWENIEDFYLMQYTGLKDKNDNAIYEGDITESYDGYVRYVIWKDNSWKYCLKVKRNYRGESYIETLYNDIGDTKSKRFGDKVIGNIYENPELLK
jgi:uncharacterized phage protein (TIGR01671 family)